MSRIEGGAIAGGEGGGGMRRIARRLREDGLWRLARKGLGRGAGRMRNLYLRRTNRRFDRAFRVETGGIVAMSELAADGAEGRIDSDYQAVDAVGCLPPRHR